MISNDTQSYPQHDQTIRKVVFSCFRPYVITTGIKIKMKIKVKVKNEIKNITINYNKTESRKNKMRNEHKTKHIKYR